MKRFTVLMIAMLISGLAFAQPVKLNSAIEELADYRLKAAKDNIEEAMEHEKTKNDPKTWYYAGKIYMTIYIVSTMDDAIEVGMSREMVRRVMGEPEKNRRHWMQYEPEMKINFDEKDNVESFSKPADGAYENLMEEPLVEAYQAFQKSISLDEDKEFTAGVTLELNRMSSLTYNAAVQAYNAKEFEEAITYFMKTVDLKKTFGEVDTNSIYNAALSATNAKMYDKALELYQELIKHEFANPAIYTAASQIYMFEEDTANAIDVLLLGRKRYPGDYNVIINLTNIYLAEGDVEKSTDLLNLALEKQPDNEQLYYNVGVVYDEAAKDTLLSDEKRDELLQLAVKNYESAIELKEDYFDAYYNLGALYFNNGVQILLQANELPLSETEKYDQLKEKANDQFQKALPYLERAYELKPDDRNTLLALKELYTRTKQYDKLKEINEKLGQ